MATQLQVLSSYTLLQSTIDLNQLVDQAQKLGYTSVALTDINVTYGLVKFYKLAHQKHLHPILGMTIAAPGLIEPTENYHLVVLAKNIKGYHNLLKLSTALMTQADHFRLPNYEALLEDLIMIVPTQQSELSQLLFKGSSKVADYVQALKKIKHHDLYLGVGLCNHADRKSVV